MFMVKKVIVFCLVLMICIGSTAFAGEIPFVVCTSFPCYDFARAVGGDQAHVSMLIKPGSEVHSYEPTPADILSIAKCDLFVYIGGESDAWVEDILSSLGENGPETLRLFDCVEVLESEHDHDHDEMEYDEHIWTSPVNAKRMVEAIAERMNTSFYWYGENYLANAENYCAQIETLDAQFRDVVENAVRREMIFADRFPFVYFAHEYGIEYHAAFPNCSSESEPSAKTMMELIEKVVSDRIPAVYTIELSTGKTAKTISEETGAEILTFHSIQNVSEEDFAAGETYITLMQRNVEALKKGLN